MHSLVTTVFNEEITEQGLRELREKYPSDVVHDMSDDEQFKAARKIRTERNKLVESINRKRIDITSELKSKGDSLVEEVSDIYSHIIEPFEAEDARRKEEAARIKREQKEKLNAERRRISDIRNFVGQCRGKDSDYIEGMIESVDLIETDAFHKDLIHDAITAKRETMEQLTTLLADTRAREKLDAERAAMAEEKAKMEAEKAEIEAWKREKAAQEEAAKQAEAPAAEPAKQDEPQAETEKPVKESCTPSFNRGMTAMEINAIVQFVTSITSTEQSQFAAELKRRSDEFIQQQSKAAA